MTHDGKVAALGVYIILVHWKDSSIYVSHNWYSTSQNKSTNFTLQTSISTCIVLQCIVNIRHNCSMKPYQYQQSAVHVCSHISVYAYVRVC